MLAQLAEEREVYRADHGGKVISLDWRRRMGTQTKEHKDRAIMVKPQYLSDAILAAHLPAKARDFLDVLDKGTFYKHGIHQRDGTPEHWCEFDMAAWVRWMGCPKPNVHRVRDYLVSLNIIHTRIDAAGQLWVGYNLDVATWIAAPQRGGARTGAGRPSTKTIQNDNDQAANNGHQRIQNDNELIQNDNESVFKMITTRQHKESDRAASHEPKELSIKELEEDDTTVSSGVRTDALPPDNGLTPLVLDAPSPRRRRTKPPIPTPDQDCYKAAVAFRTALLLYAPTVLSVPEESPEGLAEWADDMRKMHDLDKRTWQQVKAAIAYVQTNDFWPAHVHSVAYLRKKMATLLMQIQQRREGNGKTQGTATGRNQPTISANQDRSDDIAFIEARNARYGGSTVS